MDMPPSRYKVVEKGRRLIVVDTYSGEAVSGNDRAQQSRIDAAQRTSRAASPPAASPSPAPRDRPISKRTGAAFTTEPWFDNKGPRAIQLTENAQTSLIVAGVAAIVGGLILFFTTGFFVFIVALVVLAQTRKGVRAGITAWLDNYAVD